MADPARARKLAVRIREVVASTLERQIKDPRLGMVTVTDARVTPDLAEATVFYTVYGDDVARAESALALESAKGVLRSQVGRQTGVKVTPSLTFVHDALPDDARHLEDLIAVARARDERVAAARAGARPAGDADPYRRPRTVDSGDSGDEDDGYPVPDPADERGVRLDLARDDDPVVLRDGPGDPAAHRDGPGDPAVRREGPGDPAAHRDGPGDPAARRNGPGDPAATGTGDESAGVPAGERP